MESFTGCCPVRFSCHPSVPRVGLLCTGDGGTWKGCRKSYYLSRGLQHARLWSLAPVPSSASNHSSWRIRASNGNGRTNKRGVGQSKGGGLGKKDDRKKDNAWSSGGSSERPKGISDKKVEKKHQKNVWNSDSSDKSLQTTEGNKGGKQFVSPRRKNLAFGEDDKGHSLKSTESSNATPVSSPTEKRSHQSNKDAGFLRFLSPVLPIEDQVLLQIEEPVPNPSWPTFCGNTSGVWSGVGAAFSPITGEFEPISLDDKKKYIYDARVLNTVEIIKASEGGAILAPEQQSLHRKVFWSLENTSGQADDMVMVQDDVGGSSLSAQGDMYNEVEEFEYWEEDKVIEADDEKDSEWQYFLADAEEIDEGWEVGEEELELMEELEENNDTILEDDTDWTSMWGQKEVLDGDWEDGSVPAGESETNSIAEQKNSSRIYTPYSFAPSTSIGSSDSANLTDAPGMTWTDLIEEDRMDSEPGLVFFEDGAYSRGPLELFTESSTSGREYVDAHTFKVEQCLVAGGHRRLRVVHTVSVGGEEEQVEVLRLAVYEEEWMRPSNLKLSSDLPASKLKLFSERARHVPDDLVGSWKVFEVKAMANFPSKTTSQPKASFLFSCKEASFKRGLPIVPELSLNDGETCVDLTGFSMLWLTGKISTYVVVGGKGELTFGIGWISDDMPRLVMERVYHGDGKLSHVNSKSEIKRTGR